MAQVFDLLNNYRALELRSDRGPSPLPNSPTDSEKFGYTRRRAWVLLLASLVSFTCITISTLELVAGQPWLFPLYILLGYTVVYFVISASITLFSQNFDLKAHRRLVRNWYPAPYPSVDVFLPTCGEGLDVLRNTWEGVAAMRRAYRGVVMVHCLDDAHSPAVRDLAEEFGFFYHARPNRGWFKKAGNLRHGFANSAGEFIAIFDADFRPRSDFLDELLPYFYLNPNAGIVQSPQFFGFRADQNWLERGAGAVQELFYRNVQVSRQSYGGAICVGSNAIYRRAALNQIGGTALVEHSEDVHTGFELRRKGWEVVYVPIVLAKGLCPSDLKAFFKQQYRWCSGSMSLLGSRAFWETRLPFMTRLCFASGFMYYIHTAIYAVFTPVIPLVMLLALPHEVRLMNYALILPSFLYLHVIFPMWHNKPQGMEAASVRQVYGWAHLFAIIDKLRGSVKEWQPTGASHAKDRNYDLFRAGVIIFNLIPALIWVGMASYDMTIRPPVDFVPILALGVYYLATTLKIVAYRSPPSEVEQIVFRHDPAARPEALRLSNELRV